MKTVLIAAGVYNVVWGAAVVLVPHLFFDLAGMQRPLYPQLWQCIGMIVGVYGVGYVIAAGDPVRHWPIVLVGLLGKVFGPIGFGWSLYRGDFPLVSGLTILTNDLVWWVPFAAILWHALRESTNLAKGEPGTVADALARPVSVEERSLRDISADTPILLVFLRHFGCTFCREALTDIRRQRRVIEISGTRIVLVHMVDDATARDALSPYGLDDLLRISDPELKLYRAFGLERGTVRQLFGPRVWIRGIVAGLFDRHGVGALAGDGFQMPGVFLIRKGAVEAAYLHRAASDRPDYAGLACAAHSAGSGS
jgi:peroxiredoxin